MRITTFPGPTRAVRDYRPSAFWRRCFCETAIRRPLKSWCPSWNRKILVVPSFRQTLGTVVCSDDHNKLPQDLIGALDGHENPGVNPYVLQELVPDTERAENDPH